MYLKARYPSDVLLIGEALDYYTNRKVLRSIESDGPCNLQYVKDEN